MTLILGSYFAYVEISFESYLLTKGQLTLHQSLVCHLYARQTGTLANRAR